MGQGGVGKSAFIIRLICDKFVGDYDPTLEDSYRKAFTVDGKEIIVDIFDTAGMEEFTTVSDAYLSMSDYFLFMFSITNKSSLEEIEAAICNMSRVKEMVAPYPMVMVGCKGDLEEEREVSQNEIKQKAKEHNFQYFETSALTGHNVKEVLDFAIQDYQTNWNRAQDVPQKQSRPPKK
uniref:Uncharacterized protein n=1 Tax=Arcella intermedia TaxID=1963864 RepID=A0A6B2LM01_9EUKA